MACSVVARVTLGTPGAGNPSGTLEVVSPIRGDVSVSLANRKPGGLLSVNSTISGGTVGILSGSFNGNTTVNGTFLLIPGSGPGGSLVLNSLVNGTIVGLAATSST